MAPKIYFNHFDNEPADAARFYELIGRIIVVWGRVDAAMDGALLHIMEHQTSVGGRRPVSNAFTAKMERWEQVFGSEPMVADCRDDALALVAGAKELHEARNRLIHGSIGRLQTDATSRAFKFEHRKEKSFYQTYTVGIADLEEHLEAVLELSTRVSAEATGALLRAIAPNPADIRRGRRAD